jgi:hypothetical protein
MAYAPGQSIGHYRILGALGAGAMGEVYRAQDRRLDREVAIKVLPEHLAGEEERLRRFEREAKTLAALNHPNVAQIHGVDRDGDTYFLVLELVPGESLDERLRRGPFPLDEALDVARQIATGLEAAHEAGVIHRDLKPANVRLTPEGTVKLLDFGLAKSTRTGREPAEAGSAVSTEAGRLLGTPTYMAPEQARGRPVDRRIDIWAFGCVLYECLTGVRAFAGATLTDVLAAVIEREPDWSRLPGATPARVRELLVRCLRKDPYERLRDIGDARNELVRPSDGTAPAHPREPRAPRRAARLRLAGLVISSCALAVALLAWRNAAQPAEARLRRLELALGDFETEWFAAPMLSPDGSRIAFVGDGRLRVEDLEAFERRDLAPLERPSPLMWSPDGAWIGYGSRGKLWRAPAAGGVPAAIGEVPGSGALVGGTWGEDGALLIAVWRGGLYRISVASGAATLLLAPDPSTQVDFHFPSFLPDGRILFVTHWQEQRDARDEPRVFVSVLDEGVVRTVDHPAFHEMAWPVFDDGKVIFLRSEPERGIFALDFDAAVASVAGEPLRVVRGAVSISVASDGSLLYAESSQNDARFELGWLDRAGNWTAAVGAPHPGLTAPAISPDGRRIAFAAGGEHGRGIWVHDIARGTESRLTFEPGDHDAPQWVDDDRVLYTSWDGEGSPLGCVAVLRNADGSGSPRTVGGGTGPGVGERRVVPTPDPDRYLQIVDSDGRGVLRLSSGTGEGSEQHAQRLLREEPEPNVTDVSLSPDGRLLAYVAADRDLRQVFLTRFPSGDGKWQASDNGGRAPRWDPRTGALYFLDGVGPSGREGWMAAVAIDADDAVPLGVDERLFDLADGAAAAAQLWRGFDVEAGGARFLVVRPHGGVEGEASRAVLVQNWRALLEGEDR